MTTLPSSRVSEHPRYTIALRMRTKRRTLNLAVALVGRSTGWGRGRGDKPRRTFIGHHRGKPYHRGFEVVWCGPEFASERVLLKVRTGSGL